jgi:hypothetical protein
MTGLVLLWCLAQAPSAQPVSPVAVVVSSKRPGADTFAAAAAARVHAALLREGLPINDALDDVQTGKKVKAAGFSDARNCQGGASCLTKLAVLLGPNAVVVGVDVGKIGSQLAIRLEAVSSKTGKSLFVSDVSAPVEGWGDKVAVPVALFARQLVEKLAALAPPPAVVIAPPVVVEPVRPPADAPLTADLTPPPQPPAEVKASSRPAAVKWTLGVGAFAAAGVSVGFLAAGLGTRAQFNGRSTMVDGMLATLHTAAEADRLAASSNTQLTISLISAAVAGALLVATLIFFATE